MKIMKIAAIATIVTAIIMLSCAVAFSANAEGYGEFYPRLTVVVGSVRIDDHLWVVNCKDREGNIWSFFDDCGTWTQGDIANLLMWNTSEQEENDEIIDIYWEGYTEDTEGFFYVTGWRQ